MKRQSAALILVAMVLSIGAVSYAATIKGDFNGDGKIDQNDLQVITANYGKAGDQSKGDLNNSNSVGVIDLSIFLNLLRGAGTGTGTTSKLIQYIDYANATSLKGPGMWKDLQIPSAPGINGALQTDRQTIVRGTNVPGLTSQTYRPTAAMRIELRPYDNPATPGTADGDVSTISSSDDYVGSSRNEVQGETLPNNVTRWYGYSLYVPADFVPDDTNQNWLFITQFHDSRSKRTSPVTSLGIYNKNLRFVMRKIDPKTGEKSAELKKMEVALTPGKWMRIEFGMKLATDKTGWIEMWINGTKVPPVSGESLTGIETQNLYDNQPDPLYIKQGMYQKIKWTTAHTFYYGPMKIGTDRTAVLP